MEKYPLGIQSFSGLRRDGYVYVDKTELIYRLISRGKYYFLSRPRRFGKSLLMSTIESLFRGNRDLFKGLYIDTTDYDWTPYPVLYLNLALVANESMLSLEDTLNSQILKWEKEYGVLDKATTYGVRLYNVIESAYRLTGKRVVVLIDEYDKPLINNQDNPSLFEDIRNLLRSVYSVMKMADDYIRFGMITGVSRFSKVSIFSDLNNLDDISFDDDYAAICGITEEEIHRYFKSGVERLAEKRAIDYDDAIKLLKDNYDGYHFTKQSPDIFNPFSMLKAMRAGEIGSYWFETGTPDFIAKEIAATGADLAESLRVEITQNALAMSEIGHYDLTSKLFQAGYLTIKSYNWQYKVYTLGVPNREVEEGIFEALLPIYSGKSRGDNSRYVLNIQKAASTGDPYRLLEEIKKFFASIPGNVTAAAVSAGAGKITDAEERKVYEMRQSEYYYQSLMLVTLTLAGFRTTAEHSTSDGRIDLVMEDRHYLYVIELKLDRTATEAMDQINRKQYALQWGGDGRKIFKIGLNISSKTRTVSDYSIEEIQ